MLSIPMLCAALAQRGKCKCSSLLTLNNMDALSMLSLSLSLSLSALNLSLSARMSGWQRDLTREGVEANPGPALCQHAGCDCAMSRKELTESKENDGYGLQLNGACPGCTHLVSAHQKEMPVAAATVSGAAGQLAIANNKWRKL